MKLQELNSHPRDNRIFFDEEPHIYYVDDKKVGTSCTTLIHTFFPSFNEKEVSKNCVKYHFNNETSKYYQKSQNDILNMWEDNRKEAAEKGTFMHKSIELFYNDEPYDNSNIEFKYFEKFFTDNPHLEAYRTEWEVYDEELDLAGSIDMVYKNKDTNNFDIYDWKRSKEIKKDSRDNAFSPIDHIPNSNFWQYSLQLNIYKYILEKNYNIKIGDLYLVVLHPNHYTYRKIKAPLLADEVFSITETRKNFVNKMS